MAKIETASIKLTQGICGHRTRTIPPATRVVKDDAGRTITITDPERVEAVGDFAYNPGDVIDWPVDEAKKFVERGYAQYATAK